MTGTVLPQIGYQLGNRVLFEPLKVVVKFDGETWVALLEPQEETDWEYGIGSSAEAAIADLASTVREMAEGLLILPDEKLGKSLGRYKRILAERSLVNST